MPARGRPQLPELGEQIARGGNTFSASPYLMRTETPARRLVSQITAYVVAPACGADMTLTSGFVAPSGSRTDCYAGVSQRARHCARVDRKLGANDGQRRSGLVSIDDFLDTLRRDAQLPARDTLTIQYRKDSVAINVELGRQIVNLRTCSVLSDQVIDLHWAKPVLRLPGGSNFGPFWPGGNHFEDVPDAFSLVTEVRITSQHLHWCCRFDSSDEEVA